MTEAFSESTFEELDINENIKRAVKDMGFELMTPIQAQAIPILLTGRDVIGQAQTGTGKTAAFGLPILQKIDPDNKNLQAVVLCPTRELAVQAANDFRDFTKYMHDVKVLPVYGGQNILQQIRGLKGVQIIVGTPGRVMDHMSRHTIKMDDVSMVVLDEADEMLDMGFREDMEIILGAIEREHQTCLFSATMPREILALAAQYQKDAELIKVTKQELTIDRIKQYYYPIKHEYKDLALERLLNFYNYQKSIVFCNTKSMADQLSKQLQEKGFSAEALHGDLTQAQRDNVMGRFRNTNLNILIATDIAARGIDVDDVEAVFNFDLPQESEYYVHRIGRTGRAGKEGASHTLCRSKDFRKLHEIEQVCHTSMEERKIPNAEEIRKARQLGILANVMNVLADGHSGQFIPAIREFCRENEISPEAFAAACLGKELGSMTLKDEIDINLPDKEESGRRKRHGRDGRDRFGDRDREGRESRSRFGDRDGEGRESRSRFGDRDREGRESRSRFGDRDGRGRFGDRDKEGRESRSRFGSRDGRGRFGDRDKEGRETRDRFGDRDRRGRLTDIDRKSNHDERESRIRFSDRDHDRDRRSHFTDKDADKGIKNRFSDRDKEVRSLHSDTGRSHSEERGRRSEKKSGFMEKISFKGRGNKKR